MTVASGLLKAFDLPCRGEAMKNVELDTGITVSSFEVTSR